MLRLIKQEFIGLLCFSKSLVTKFMSLNNESCMIRSTLIDLNFIELNYYPFMISLDNCSRSCNSANDLSIKIYILNKSKNTNVKVSKMITNKNEAKTMAKHVLCYCKCKFNSATYNSNQKWNNDKCQCESKNYLTCWKHYIWNPSTCIFENGMCLKSILMIQKLCAVKLYILLILYVQICQQILVVNK